MDPKIGGELISCPAEESEFLERFAVINRGHTDVEFRDGLVANFNPPYLIK